MSAGAWTALATGLAAAAGAVHLLVGRPLEQRVQHLATQASTLQAEIESMRAQLARLQHTSPPALPPLAQVRERVSRIAALLPPETGYSLNLPTAKARGF